MIQIKHIFYINPGKHFFTFWLAFLWVPYSKTLLMPITVLPKVLQDYASGTKLFLGTPESLKHENPLTADKL